MGNANSSQNWIDGSAYSKPVTQTTPYSTPSEKPLPLMDYSSSEKPLPLMDYSSSEKPLPLMDYSFIACGRCLCCICCLFIIIIIILMVVNQNKN
jgi:hypothetical protein